MSISKPKTKVRLDVETKDVTADIYVIDSFFRVVGRGRGEKQLFHLKPGIYTVKVRVGFENREKDIVLIEKPEKASFEAIEFSSAIPLIETSRTHKYHIAAAETESRKIHLKHGEGCWIFIFARDWISANSERQFQTTSLPHKGLTLKGSKGETIVNFETDKRVAFDNSLDAWAACNIELAPGQYRLSVKIDLDKSIEQTIVACRGWQTQVFLLQKNYHHKKMAEVRRADLTNTGILMFRGKIDSQNPQILIGGFNSRDPKMKLLDLARLGLTNNRQVLPDEVIDRILYGKFENPMLGILGAYLLLKSNKTKLNLFKEVINNLRRILGEGMHPDVEALALRVESKQAKYNFDLPPMLRQSWIQVVKSTTQNPDLIPIDSFASQNSERVLGDEPWLLYLSKKQDAATIQAVDNSVRYLVDQELSHEKELLVSPLAVSHSMPIREKELSETNLAGADDAVNSQETTIEDTTFLPVKTVVESVPKAMDDKTVNDLVNNMGLPKAKIIQILNRLEL